jgi:peptide deformylase
MAIRKLTNWNAESLCGNPLFRKKSRPVESFDERLWTLLDDMRETLEKVGGYGCAAVHVGILRRVVVILDDSGVIELVNPTIIEISSETQEVKEGSIAPDSPQDVVRRPKSVTVSGFDRNGNAITVSSEDFLAATLCHEIDHLDGVLFTDRVVENEIDENGNAVNLRNRHSLD